MVLFITRRYCLCFYTWSPCHLSFLWVSFLLLDTLRYRLVLQWTLLNPLFTNSLNVTSPLTNPLFWNEHPQITITPNSILYLLQSSYLQDERTKSVFFWTFFVRLYIQSSQVVYISRFSIFNSDVFIYSVWKQWSFSRVRSRVLSQESRVGSFLHSV